MYYWYLDLDINKQPISVILDEKNYSENKALFVYNKYEIRGLEIVYNFVRRRLLDKNPPSFSLKGLQQLEDRCKRLYYKILLTNQQNGDR